uniref:RING-type E3 ubiquitin transferase n=1 Tax=Kalanchoe fedtschenkoi TaxID=63787 RepID=A0A7N0R941_KALFE
MEASGMEETVKVENHGSSAADFVEGGLQEACDDACSICLENYTESDPSTVTICKHEFHLQCILEWGQRSSQCPMCWQSLRLKDPTSQELFEAVEQERNFRMAPPRNTMIFRHPTFGDFELQHLPAGTNIHELEERIIQHLTAAAAMGRARHMARREGHRSRAHDRPQFMSGSPHHGASSAEHHARVEGEGEAAASNVGSPSRGLPPTAEESPHHDLHATSIQGQQVSGSTSSHHWSAHVSPNHRQYSPPQDDSAGPSDLHSFSESLKSRFNAISMRYKESISKNARELKERLFSRSPPISEIGPEVRRDVNAGMATISRMMDRLESTASGGSSPDHQHHHDPDASGENPGRHPPSDSDKPPASSSVSN